jgi:hypothetical protein
MGEAWRLVAVIILGVMILGVGSSACTRSARNGEGSSGALASVGTARPNEEFVEEVFRGGFKNGWQDSGWAPRSTDGATPAAVHFANEGGWVLAKPGLAHAMYGALVFREKPPKGEAEFLEVRVESPTLATFPRIKVGAQHRYDVGGGWYDIRIPMFELDPEEAPFDRIVFRAFRAIDDEVTLLDGIGFTKGDPAAAAAARLNPATYAANGKPVSLHVECNAKATPINPLIYGIAYYPITDESPAQWKMGAVSRRWGGNTSSRYNWEQSVWNLDADWFFENKPIRSYEAFLADNEAHGLTSALTIPILGWVAKDATSYSFPVSAFGPQGKVDPYNGDVGDGKSLDGKKLVPGPPTRTSQAAPPEWVKRWVLAIRARDAKTRKRSVGEYILDNEPMLWTETHRDVRTEPLGYDELLERTIEYGTAIRQADPDAVIAGPAEWGWSGYLYSAKDSAAGVTLRPDRRAHDDKPLIEWYLEKLRRHEEKTGVRVLDLLDLHFYPQAPNVYGNGGTDAKTASLRLRSTRALWDPSYVDESWIKEPVRLLPRMKEWVDKNYPGRGISIGEWNFGGEGHVTGALAIAEALGRFAEFGVTSAYYWTHPADDAPALQGFLAYRNFDGKGGRFLDAYLPSVSGEGVSLFASRDGAGQHVVAIAINMSAEGAALANVELRGCGPLASHQAYTYMRGARGFIVGAPAGESLPSVEVVLPPWSITVLDVHLAKPLSGSAEQ